MDYIRAIIWSIFYLVIFDFTLGKILNFFQSLGNILHRYVGRIFIIYKEYLMCVLLSTFTETYVERHNMNANVLLGFFTFFLLAFTVASYKDTKENDYAYGGHNSDSAALIGMSFTILIWFIYYFKLYFLTKPIEWFKQIISFVLDIPILGSIISFIGNIFTGIILLYLLYLVITLLLALIAKLFTRKNADTEDLSQE